MNDSDLQNLFLKMRTEKLSALERTRIRERLLTMINQKPVVTYREFSFMRFIWVSGARRVSVAVLAVFVVVFGSVSYAAEGALPGDALYALKTQVNEPIRLALAISDKAKASVEADLAGRRLDEVSMLATENRLSENVQEELLSQAAQHVISLRLRLDESGNNLDENDIAKLTSQLEASHDARSALSARVLSPLSDEKGSGTAPVSLMMSAEALSTTTLTRSAEVFKGGATTSVEDVARSHSEEQLKRVEEEYGKIMSILGSRRSKISREKEGRTQVESKNRVEELNKLNSGATQNGILMQEVSSTTNETSDKPKSTENGLVEPHQGSEKSED